MLFGRSGTIEIQSPGYPLESPGLVWGSAAAFAYSFGAVMLFDDSLFPQPLQDIIHAIFRSHDNIVILATIAVSIHVAYVIFAIGLSQKRGYDAKATAWWAVQCFVFGFLGVNMLIKKESS